MEMCYVSLKLFENNLRILIKMISIFTAHSVCFLVLRLPCTRLHIFDRQAFLSMNKRPPYTGLNIVRTIYARTQSHRGRITWALENRNNEVVLNVVPKKDHVTVAVFFFVCAFEHRRAFRVNRTHYSHLTIYALYNSQRFLGTKYVREFCAFCEFDFIASAFFSLVHVFVRAFLFEFCSCFYSAAYLARKKTHCICVGTWYANGDVIKCWDLWKICMNFFTLTVLLLLLLPFSGFFRFNYFNAMFNSAQQLRYRLRICDAVCTIDSCEMCTAFSHRPCRLNINWNYRELGAVHLNCVNTMWFFC